METIFLVFVMGQGELLCARSIEYRLGRFEQFGLQLIYHLVIDGHTKQLRLINNEEHRMLLSMAKTANEDRTERFLASRLLLLITGNGMHEEQRPGEMFYGCYHTMTPPRFSPHIKPRIGNFAYGYAHSPITSHRPVFINLKEAFKEAPWPETVTEES